MIGERPGGVASAVSGTSVSLKTRRCICGTAVAGVGVPLPWFETSQNCPYLRLWRWSEPCDALIGRRRPSFDSSAEVIKR